MGKKGSGSWLTAVKRAFTTTRKHQHQDDHPSKREKRKWLFRKSSNGVQQPIDHVKASSDNMELGAAEVEEKRAISMPATDTSVHTAAEIIRFTTTACRPVSASVKHHFAAILIQTSFRGYLARRAMRALKGIVTLQAVIRGQNVRKQATITLRCMQALLRVQSRLHDQRARLSHDGGRKPMNPETPKVWESKYLQDIRQRKSMSRDGSFIPDDWSDMPHTLEELDAILQSRKEANALRETAAFSQQIWKSDRNQYTVDDNDIEERASWLDRWIEAKQWESHRSSRASFDRRDSIKTVDSRLDSRSVTGTYKFPYPGSHYIPNSPSRRSSYSPSIGQQPITPSPIKTRPLQVRSASPRCMKEERGYLNANIQSLRSTPRVIGALCHYSTCASDMTMPNYMAATESAKARIRSQSTPRQRPSTPERERVGSVKKRLAYPVADPCDNDSNNYKAHYCGYGYNLRSPSFKSVQVGHVGMGQQSFYTDSAGVEISPCSTTDLRRWIG